MIVLGEDVPQLVHIGVVGQANGAKLAIPLKIIRADGLCAQLLLDVLLELFGGGKTMRLHRFPIVLLHVIERGRHGEKSRHVAGSKHFDIIEKRFCRRLTGNPAVPDDERLDQMLGIAAGMQKGRAFRCAHPFVAIAGVKIGPQVV